MTYRPKRKGLRLRGKSTFIDFGVRVYPGASIIAQKDDPRYDPPSSLARKRRSFVVNVVLARQYYPGDVEPIISPDPEDGDSYLELPGLAWIDWMMPMGELLRFQLVPNSVSRLGRVTADVMGDAVSEVFNYTFSGARSLVSFLSCFYQRPIYVTACQVLDPELSGTLHQFMGPYTVRKVKEIEEDGRLNAYQPLGAEYAACFSFYREALCSHSFMYRVLCLYKIIETVLDVIRPANMKQMKRIGGSFQYPDERIQAANYDEAVRHYFEPHDGLSYSRLKSSFLQPLRTKAAHYLYKRSSSLVILDDTGQYQEFVRAYPVAHEIAHDLLVHEMEMRQKLLAAEHRKAEQG